mmetsp:Transcript_19943/g.55340  ORF Transcript_19943/g.55340 Transcript_19943/m.55340 type:complete len:237 (-) Transcript_19943:103-813(-)
MTIPDDGLRQVACGRGAGATMSNMVVSNEISRSHAHSHINKLPLQTYSGRLGSVVIQSFGPSTSAAVVLGVAGPIHIVLTPAAKTSVATHLVRDSTFTFTKCTFPRVIVSEDVKSALVATSVLSVEKHKCTIFCLNTTKCGSFCAQHKTTSISWYVQPHNIFPSLQLIKVKDKFGIRLLLKSDVHNQSSQFTLFSSSDHFNATPVITMIDLQSRTRKRGDFLFGRSIPPKKVSDFT